MRILLTAISLLCFCVAVVLTPLAIAMPEFLDSAKAQYPSISGTRLDACSLCHVSESDFGLNSYGQAYADNSQSFSAIEGLDSDGDGSTNLQEITALTFPGDAADFPGSGGGDRVSSRGTAANVTDASALALATDTARKEALAGWVDATGAARGRYSRAAGTVSTVLLSSDGSTKGKVVDLEDVNADPGLSVAYGLKRFLVAWNGTDGDVVGQMVKAKKGKKLKSPKQILADADGPAAIYDSGLKRFLVASSAADGVVVNQVDKKGTVKARAAWQPREVVDGIASALGFAGTSSEGQVLLGAEASGANRRPVGVLLVDGATSSVSSGFGRFGKNLAGGGAFGAAEEGVVAWSRGGTISVAGLAGDGSMNGSASTVKKQKAERVAVAAQSDGNFLVVWTDPAAKKLMAVDVDADGKVTGDPFELQDTGEVVDPDVLAVAAVGTDVMVIYATSGANAAVRSVVVGPQ